jgi:CubicO group peptidase (beta-lactamase class C family)
MTITRSITAIILAGLMCASANAQNAAKSTDPLPRAKPEEVGMSSERLADIAKTLNTDIAHGQMPGAVLAVARHGKLAYFEAFGYRDKAANAAMTTDAIFNIASMARPMTAVAALQLYEQGKLLMDEPLAKYFPKFADMQVAVLDASRETIIDKVPATRKITIQDLFRHTSGFSYGGRGTTAKFECGGGCAASTAGDYMRFAQMLLNKGKYGDARILSRKTVEFMLSNQIGPEVRNLVGNADPTRADYGFGLGLAVQTTPGTRAHGGLGRQLLMARRQRHQLVG